MAEVLDTKGVKHYLQFNNENGARIQIDEPLGWDSAELTIEQEEKRYGRDVSFSGGEIDFTFPNTAGSRYGYQFEKLIWYDDLYGYESEVSYIIVEDDTDFVVGQLDFYTRKTDRFNYFECRVIQETQQQLLKRRSKTEINLFATTDIDGNDIEAVETSNILLEAKPVTQASEWNCPAEIKDTLLNDTGMKAFNFINNVISYEIEDSLSYIAEIDDNGSDFIYIDAQSDLTDVTVKGEDISMLLYSNNWGSPSTLLRYRIGTEFDGDDTTIVDIDLGAGDESGFNRNYENIGFEFNVDIPAGSKLWVYFVADIGSFGGIETFVVTFYQGSITISATSTAINTVTKGVRLIDAMKQVNTNLNTELQFSAPRFDDNGEWYDNFVFDGNMIRGRETKFTMSWDDISDMLPEFNSDYEVDSDSVFVGKYDDFYRFEEVGSFLIAPNSEFAISYNERYAINRFDFMYDKYDQDKDDDGTIDGVHTEVKFSVNNKQVENEKEVEVSSIRDAFMLETTRRKAFASSNSGTSSLVQDNKVFIVDIVELEEGAGQSFTDEMYHLIDNAEDTETLQLISNGDFRWDLLGLEVGQDFNVLNTDNADTYTVHEIGELTLTLIPQNIELSDTGVLLTTVSYLYSNVTYKIRTDEGFTSITGVDSADSYANLLYTPKRNILNNWGSYLSTCAIYNDRDITVQSFVNENELVTNYNDEGEVVENSDIAREDLAEPILSPRMITTKVICDFSKYDSYSSLIQSVRGFIRVYDNDGRIRKGFPMSSKFNWAENTLELVLEEMYENESLNISFDYDANSYVINRAGYSQGVLPDLTYVIEGEYIHLTDWINRPLSAKYRYDKVVVQGETYDNISDLAKAISIL